MRICRALATMAALLMASSLGTGCDEKSTTGKTTEPADFVEDSGELKLQMVYIAGSEFVMGSPETDPLAYEDELPEHNVTLAPYYIGRHEVTQGQWTRVMGTNPSHFSGCDDCPVENVSYLDIMSFLGELNEMTGKDYRLPTEAEWEHACRAGSTARYYFDGDESGLGDRAWSVENAGGKTHSVGQKAPNAWSLHDMYGNVEEWVADRYERDYYAKSPGSDPVNSDTANPLVVNRGGSFKDKAWLLGSTYRMWNAPDYRFNGLGFRLALSVSE